MLSNKETETKPNYFIHSNIYKKNTSNYFPPSRQGLEYPDCIPVKW